MTQAMISFISVVLFFFAVLSFWSNWMTDPEVGLRSNKLKKCGSKPNCVCSEFNEDETHFIDSIELAGSEIDPRKTAVEVIQTMGGEIKVDNANFIHATFRTKIFRFKDDFELRLADDRVQIRSASRVGYSDLGQNRRRALEFHNHFKSLISDQRNR